MKQRLSALILAGAVAVAAAAPVGAVDAQPDEAPVETVAQEVRPVERSVLYYGEIAAIRRDETGAPDRLVMTSEPYGAYIMVVTEDTLWVDSGRQTAFDPAELREGERVYVFHSAVSTRSIPPQSVAFAVVRDVPQDAGSAIYHVVEDLTVGEDGSVRILTDGGGLYISADEKTGLSAYQEGTAFALADLKVGDRVMAWYQVVLTSYPGQTYASHLMLLPERSSDVRDPGHSQPEEGAQLSLVLDGDPAAVTGRYEGGTAMVPVAAVAQALGLQVTYTPGQEGRGAQITVETEDFQVRMYAGEQLIVGVTKIPGAVGMTAPQDYGRAPYIVAPGTTWAPAQLFELLGKTVALEGDTLDIR